MYFCSPTNYFAITEQIRMPSKVSTAEKYSQASIETANTYVQTDDFSLNDANCISYATEMNLASQQEFINQPTAQLPGEINVNGLPSGPLSSQPPVSYGVQQVDPFFASHMWPNVAQYSDYQGYSAFFSTPVTSVPSSMAVSDGFSGHHNALYNHDVLDVNQGSKAIISRHESVQSSPQHQRMTSSIPKDIVDEREDLAIEQSLKDCESTALKHSYASALWQGEFGSFGSRDGAVVRALASHQCGSGSILGLDAICELNLLVLFSAREVFPRVLRFSPLLKNQHFRIAIRSGYSSGRIATLWRCHLNSHLIFDFFYFEFVLGFLIEKKLSSVSHLQLSCSEKHRNKN